MVTWDNFNADIGKIVTYLSLIFRILKSNLFQNGTDTHIFKLFSANIWIFKFFIIMNLAVKMCLDNTKALLNILQF